MRVTELNKQLETVARALSGLPDRPSRRIVLQNYEGSAEV
jgi:hypothetical protein